jgi:dolichol-phosphate hexosyltransferase
MNPSVEPDLSILIPVYNERNTIEQAIARINDAELNVERELIIVDDGSTDGTREWLADQTWPSHVSVVFCDRNRGKGAAVRRALAEARGRYSTIMDADLEYEPESIAALLEPVIEGRAEVVYGVRGFESHSAYGFWYVIGNRFVTLVTNALFNCWLTDVMTCHKVLPTALFRALDLREPGFATEAEITARTLAAGRVIYEVPVTYRARTRDEGKKLTAWDGLRVLRTLIRCRLTSGRAGLGTQARSTR